MCGIVGIASRGGTVDPDVLDRATRSLAHRGPDDEGTVIVREASPEAMQVGLGNRRLAILDLSPLGHQPMQDPETRNWIVHNGEVYNFREVRAKLEREGVEFRSQSDTEVALKAYGRWGERCVGEFRGMFAFAIWDAQRKRLFVARDPMGIKPLYYFQSERHFLFASELRTLLGTGLVPRKMDAAGLESYLAFGSVYEPATLVEGVRMLGPGSFLIWERGKVREAQYWDLGGAGAVGSGGASVAEGVGPSRSQLEERVYAAIDESVRMQLVSDVPVGVFLSGGIDSSALVGILRRSGVQASTFSIVFREAEFSEAEHSRAVAECFKTDHHEITVSQEDVFAAIPAAVGAMDQPTMDGVNTFFVSQQARAAEVKVALSGLGGDELFAGYSNFRSVPRMERFSQWWGHVPGGVREAVAGAFTSLRAESDQNRKLAALVRENGRLVHPYFLARMLFTPERRAVLLAGRIEADVAEDVAQSASSGVNAELRQRLDRTRDLDAVNRVSYLEARCYMLNTLLRDSDFMSMAHGLEVRVPLIDHRLAEDALAVPGAWKLSDTPKPLLVGALRGALPASIVHRPKRGFTLPFERWVREGLRDELEASIQRIEAGGIGGRISGPAARRVWSDFLRGTTSWTRPWSLFVLERWCARHLEDRN